MKPRTIGKGMNPYLAGALVGVLAVLSAWATTHWSGKTAYIGASTTFVRVAGFAESALAEAHVAQNAYFQKVPPRVDWQFLLVAGIFVGALLSSLLDRSFRFEAVPPIWRERFGPGVGRRAAGAFCGARLADGCPSGHGLSGLMQLSMSGLVALASFFLAGALVARAVFARRAS